MGLENQQAAWHGATGPLAMAPAQTPESAEQMSKTAVILFNLGGPDSPEAVRPFLFNLFNDRWIISLPQPFRWLLARLISTTRAPSARENYNRMGGRSPIVPETEKQAVALQARLDGAHPGQFKVILAMRYWRPYAADAAAAAKAWGAEKAILLPLYPQFSSTTTASAREAWAKVWKQPSRLVCCYPAGEKFIAAHADAILHVWKANGAPEKPRVLFSAHGLPQRTIDKGDPYQWQVERTVAACAKRLPADWDIQICYQSRVGPLKWIGPDTAGEIERAGGEKRGVIVSPIAFVSEHIETLVELDHEYGELAHEAGVPYYLRAPALGAAEHFIEALAAEVEKAALAQVAVLSEEGGRICPSGFALCPHAAQH
jgi:protoporphyrin/coproporphyrin ferrochelatase